jgi:hypothetical protein
VCCSDFSGANSSRPAGSFRQRRKNRQMKSTENQQKP